MSLHIEQSVDLDSLEILKWNFSVVLFGKEIQNQTTWQIHETTFTTLCSNFDKSMYQLRQRREINVSIFTEPCTNSEKSIHQLWQILSWYLHTPGSHRSILNNISDLQARHCNNRKTLPRRTTLIKQMGCFKN